MARAGIYKWDVKAARDQLLKNGRHPSVDAIRTALGDTGSKSTIHRYLKELEQEEGAPGTAGISEALQGLVAQLAERLQHEAEIELKAATARYDADRTASRAQLGASQTEVERLRTQLELTEGRLDTEKQAHVATIGRLSAEQTHGVQLREQIHGLEQRLAEQVEYRQSLEQKHENARQALEHFRAATKEQRDQEQRRHEQQVQQLQADVRGLTGSINEKLSHIAQLSRDGAALSAENGSLRTQVQQFRSEQDQLQRDIVRAKEAAQHSEGQRQALEGQVQELKSTLAEHRRQSTADAQQIRDLELAAAREGVQMEQARERIEALDAEASWLRRLADAAGIEGSAAEIKNHPPEVQNRMTLVRTEARRVLKSDSAAELWLYQRNADLGDVSPVSILSSDVGVAEARKVLMRAEASHPG